jgi:hypothetical protein
VNLPGAGAHQQPCQNQSGFQQQQKFTSHKSGIQ